MIQLMVDGRRILPTLPIVLGRVGDDGVTTAYIAMPAVCDGINLRGGIGFVHTVDAAGGRRSSRLTCTSEAEAEVMTFEWVISTRHTAAAGSIGVWLTIETVGSTLWRSEMVMYSISEAEPVEAEMQAVAFAPFAGTGNPNNEKPPVAVVGRGMIIKREAGEIGVAGDRNAESVTFRVNRYYDGQDLSAHSWFVETLDDFERYDIHAPDVTVEAEHVLVEWFVAVRQTAQAGKIRVRLRVSDGESFVWQTKTGEFVVLPTFAEGEPMPDPEDGFTYIEQAIAQMERLRQDTIDAQTGAGVYEQQAREHADGAADALAEVETIRDGLETGIGAQLEAVKEEVTVGYLSFAAPKWERVTPWAGAQSVPAASGSLMSLVADGDCVVMHYMGVNHADPGQIAIGTVSGSTGGTQSNAMRVRTGFLPVNGSALYPYAGEPETLRQYAIACYRSDYSFMVSLMTSAPDAVLPDDCVFVRLILANAASADTAITADELAGMKRSFVYAKEMASYAVMAGEPVTVAAFGQDTLVASAGNIQVGYSPASAQLDRELYVGVEASGAVVRMDGIARDTGLGVTASYVAEQAGTPTPDAPIPIVGAESVTVTVVGGENLADPSSFLVVNDVTVSDGEVYIPANRVAAVNKNVVLFDCPEGYAGQITLAYDLKHNDTTGASRKGAHLSIIYTDGTSQVASVPYSQEYARYVVISNPNKRVLSIKVGYSHSLETWMRNIMACLGSVELSYEHYRGNSYQVALGAPVYGLEGAADAVDLPGGVVTRRTARRVFDGTETLTVGTSLNDDLAAFFCATSGLTRTAEAAGLCNLFPWVKAATSDPGVECVSLRTSSSALRIFIAKDRLAGWLDSWTTAEKVAAMQAWLAGQYAADSPVTVLYELAVPVLEGVEAMELYAWEGANTVYCDGAGVTVAGLQSARGTRDEAMQWTEAVAGLQQQIDALTDLILQQP